MKMKKQLLALLLAAVMVLSLTGCKETLKKVAQKITFNGFFALVIAGIAGVDHGGHGGHLTLHIIERWNVRLRITFV